MGLYFKFSIALLYFPIIAIYFIAFKIFKINNNRIKKFKLISFKRYFRYIKLIFNRKIILIVLISSVISNSITIIQDKKFNKLHSYAQNVTLMGIIVSDKEEKEYKDVYKIKVKYCNEFKEYKNTYLYIKMNKKNDAQIEYGDEVMIKGELIPPTEQRNYGGFSYKQYLKIQNIYGIINVSNIEIKSRNRINPILYFSNAMSCKIKEKINYLISENEASILKGIILGDTSNIEEKMYEKFRVSNISHILAVSGMHVSYIVIGIKLLLDKKIGKRKTKYIIITILIFYMFLTGFSTSIVRATIMSIIVILSGILYRKNDIWTSISFSLLIILIYNPFAILDIGLQLSYAGTIGIILFCKNVLEIFNNVKSKKEKVNKKINKNILKIQKLKEILAVTVSVQIAILPIMIYHFNIFGTYFFITNLLVSIIIGPIIILSFFTIILSFMLFPIAKNLAIVLENAIKILIQVSELSRLPLSKIYFTTPKIWMICLYYSILSILRVLYQIYNSRITNNTQNRFKNLIELIKYKYREKYKTKINILIIFVIIAIAIFQIVPKSLKVNFVDVGQGDCTFIITPRNKTILIDGGGNVSSEFDVGKNILLPYILDRGYKNIDYIIISHFDQDHIRTDS